MVMKGKKLHDIPRIRGFIMAYKGPTSFAMAYKELSLCKYR
jgi:hypothetical protein